MGRRRWHLVADCMFHKSGLCIAFGQAPSIIYIVTASPESNWRRPLQVTHGLCRLIKNGGSTCIGSLSLKSISEYRKNPITRNRMDCNPIILQMPALLQPPQSSLGLHFQSLQLYLHWNFAQDHLVPSSPDHLFQFLHYL